MSSTDIHTPVAPSTEATRWRLDPARSSVEFRVPNMWGLQKVKGRFRRFDGYEAGPFIFLRRPLAETSDDLIVHELCHVWQSQHRMVRLALSYLWQGYQDNRHEVEARYAAAATRDPV